MQHIKQWLEGKRKEYSDLIVDSFVLDLLSDTPSLLSTMEAEIRATERTALIEEIRLETLKELIREFQKNELDGKGYDFYFAIRSKIYDAVSHLESNNPHTR